MKTAGVLLAGLVGMLSFSSAASAQLIRPAAAANAEASIVDSSTTVLNEIMATPAKGIPRALLADAHGIVIVPGLLKGGFVVGVRHGRGVVVVKNDEGAWTGPTFITITGGSVGWQAGIQATDVVMVFKTKASVSKLLEGKFTLGADAAAAAGPVGREASAATDATLKAEIYSYSRSRGLFAGVSLDGSAMKIDSEATTRYYAENAAGQVGQIPTSAVKLMETIAAYTNPEPAVAAGEGAPLTAVPAAGAGVEAVGAGADVAKQFVGEAEATRKALATSAAQLTPLLDDVWKSYLALPPEIASGGAPSAEAINRTLDRFNTVAADPKYRTLSQRPEFQSTRALLQKYATLRTAGQSLQLPAPPR